MLAVRGRRSETQMVMTRRAFAATAAGLAGVMLAPQSPARADTPLDTPVAATRARSVVLVHGLYADGSSWIDVVPHLQNAGLAVAVVQNPLTTLADAVAETRRVLALQPGPVVLAGHSWSGTLVSEVGVDAGLQRAGLHRRPRPRRRRGLPGAGQAVPDPAGLGRCGGGARRLRPAQRAGVPR